MAEPRLSVIVPVRNREAYVGFAIESILQQRYRDFELLVIDDGSSDRSREIVESFARDARVRIEPNPSHLGIPKTRNRGLTLARGEYVAMLDSDDVAAPERFACQVAFLDRHPDHALVGAWTAGMDRNGRVRRRLRVGPVSPAEIRARLLFQCCPAQSTIMGRTEILRRFGYREDHVVSSDFDLWVRLSRTYALSNLPAVMVRSRMHPDRVTRQKAALVQETCLRILGAQLAELDVAFGDDDLEHHYLLPRLRKRESAPDRPFLERSEQWLLRLWDANDRTGRYEAAAFAGELGRVWLLAWWAAEPSVRASAVSLLVRSRLRTAVRECLARSASLWAASQRGVAESVA